MQRQTNRKLLLVQLHKLIKPRERFGRIFQMNPLIQNYGDGIGKLEKVLRHSGTLPQPGLALNRHAHAPAGWEMFFCNHFRNAVETLLLNGQIFRQRSVDSAGVTATCCANKFGRRLGAQAVVLRPMPFSLQPLVNPLPQCSSRFTLLPVARPRVLLLLGRQLQSLRQSPGRIITKKLREKRPGGAGRPELSSAA